MGAGPPVLDISTSEPVDDLTGEQVRQGYRWCTTCKVIRPPRASHCKDCNQCVLTWDHHCPFVNNCVGQRNYGYFSAFLCSTLCLGASVFSGMGIFFYATSGGNQSSLHGLTLYGLIALIGVPTAVLALGVLGLSLFHAVLCCAGCTTKEAYRALFKGQATRGGPTLSSWRAPSLLHLRNRVSLTIV
uniref:Palmitoyltransferase n=1 Tax=Alexandrium catenella TaxID=2925 RepID=A0A7S1Q2Q8_ALECA|mmetsp:Transcript_13424/g.36931  ORF Transcript_13424/g.36931 Transcript_13424/m.36931 type:complete len:187 (+) Transcript_13424:2-562(+)